MAVNCCSTISRVLLDDKFVALVIFRRLSALAVVGVSAVGVAVVCVAVVGVAVVAVTVAEISFSAFFSASNVLFLRLCFDFAFSSKELIFAVVVIGTAAVIVGVATLVSGVAAVTNTFSSGLTTVPIFRRFKIPFFPAT